MQIYMNEPTATNKKRYHRAIKLINFVPLKVKYVEINFFLLSPSFCTFSFFIMLLRYISFYFHLKKREKELNFEHYLVE